MIKYYENGDKSPEWNTGFEAALNSLVEKGDIKKEQIVFNNISYNQETGEAVIYALQPFYASVLDATFGTKKDEPLCLTLYYYPDKTNLVDNIKNEIEKAANNILQTPLKESPFVLPVGVTYTTEDDVEFHAFHWGTNNTAAVFMISPHPAGLNHEMVDKMAADTIPILEATMSEIEGVNNMSTEIHDFRAGDFTGKVIICTLNMTDGKTVYQTMLVLWDGHRLWMGQLTGNTEDDLKMAERILNSKK